MTSTDARPVAVITGTSQGIGRAIATRFLTEGWQVISCARRDVPPAERGHANWIGHVSADLAEPDGVARFAETVLDMLGTGPLAALVNNAGVSPKTSFKERLGVLNGPIGGWLQVYALNLFAPLRLARAFARPLHRGRGAIVNVTSIAGHAVHPFAGSAYSTSKAALAALTREMAVELAELGIRVNAVAPGEIATDMIGPEYESLVPRIPLGRMGSPADVAGVVFRLCADDFRYVTGTEVFVTGGQELL